MRLFDLAEQVERVLAEAIDTETGVIDDARLEELNNLEMARDDRALAVAAYALGCEAEADAVEATAKRLMERARVHRAQGKRLRVYISECIPNGTKLRNDQVEIGWRRSQAVEVPDEEKLSDTWFRYTRTVAKDEIKAALKAGETVDGAQLVTRSHLVIR